MNWFPYIFTAIICLGLGIGEHKLTVDHMENLQRAAVAAQVAIDTHQCNMAKELTENVLDQAQKERDALNTQLSTFKRMRPRKCIVPMPSASAASRFNSGTSTSKLSVAYGVTSDALTGEAYDADKADIALTECTRLLDGIYKQNGQ